VVKGWELEAGTEGMDGVTVVVGSSSGEKWSAESIEGGSLLVPFVVGLDSDEDTCRGVVVVGAWSTK